MFESQFITYAQNGEDVLLWRALKHVQNGFYIDVGAQDPVADSVTKAFYDRGWHGINIEPVPRWHERLVELRPHDINLRLAVSNQPGAVTLFEVEDSGLSTSDPEFARRHETDGYVLHEFAVECKTLDQICADHVVDTVHFLKVDCEGAEKQALEGIALSRVRPWIILVEATEPNSTEPTWQQWEHLLTGRRYRFVFFDGLNRYYLAEEHADLSATFAAPVNVFDSARRASEIDTEAQLGRLQGEHGLLLNEHDRLLGAHGHLQSEHGRLQGEHGSLLNEHGHLKGEHGRLQGEHDRLQEQRALLQREISTLRIESRRLRENLAELLASHSWRITAPLRAISRFARRMSYLAMRKVARLLRPLLRVLAKNRFARKFATGVLGKHSRITRNLRLFLFRVPSTSAAHSSRGTMASLGGFGAQAGTVPSSAPFDLDEVMERVRAEVESRRALP